MENHYLQILTPDQERSLVKEVLAQKTKLQIAKEYGVAPATLYGILRRHGVKMSERQQ